LTFGPTQFLKALPKRCDPGLSFPIIARTHEHTDPRNLLALLPHAAIGRMIVVPLRSVMNSRRLIAAPLRTSHRNGKIE
jgi:hypothetical protein